MNIRRRDLLNAIGVDNDREALAGLPVYLRSLELKLRQAAQEMEDNDYLSDAVVDACNIVRVLRLQSTKKEDK